MRCCLISIAGVRKSMASSPSKPSLRDLAQAFTNAVNGFHGIRFGDAAMFEDITLEFDLIQLRLSRWGRFVHLDKLQAGATWENVPLLYGPLHSSSDAAKACLANLHSKLLTTIFERKALTALTPNEDTAAAHNFMTHISFNRISPFLRRQLGLGASYKLNEKRYCEGLMDRLASSVDQLEQHTSEYPANSALELRDDLEAVMKLNGRLGKRLEVLAKTRDPLLGRAIRHFWDGAPLGDGYALTQNEAAVLACKGGAS
ncbi:hypothetical protein K491DRAFT_730082 [Lophiostoma macrostomum CBS 122681]|uniref:Prion-inhibition and propagation HeLo domain-containing protein n=1 Tax=Lophiostoma macrostomum CBS 122681 TaxID=1314788 RepID=A0A6A6STP4_9PLEO|nr:hypothetical protein K491DRAFT_730082 [Lophiostoma macrostomum CBS 122681]